MIISASRRTDIPAFYSRWLINRIRAGWCEVPNPFNARQVTTVSLAPEDVDVIVFWTRNPRPLFRFLPELDGRLIPYYFQFTLLDYPRSIDEHNPPVSQSLDTFRRLVDQIGPERVIWRYDPIVMSEATPPEYHQEAFSRIASVLQGYTRRAVISLLDIYPKIRGRLRNMEAQGARLIPMGLAQLDEPGCHPAVLRGLIQDLVKISASCGMQLTSCGEGDTLKPFGVQPGKCIDDELIRRLFGREVSQIKDPGQRATCGCVLSKDIGMYDTCLFGCRYCYATRSFERARQNFLSHDPDSPSILNPIIPRSMTLHPVIGSRLDRFSD